MLLPLAAARSGATLLHASAGTMPFVRTLPTVVTVHDLAWHRVQSHTRAYARTYFGKLQARAYELPQRSSATRTSAPTNTASSSNRSAKIDVVHPGVDARFAQIKRHPDESPFALVVGTVEARKNLLVLVEALPALPALRIIAVGPPTPYADEVRARAAELSVADRIELRGYVNRERARRVSTRSAACALIPSRYEGFGYALAEALCAGVPAIAARSSSLIEVAAGDAPLVEPDDARHGSKRSKRCWPIATLRSNTRTACANAPLQRFSWASAASQMQAIYARVARS